MSGIVGIVHLDGKPADPRLLRRMTNYLAFRGPDCQNIWIDANAGFGHTMLRTTREAQHEHQPLTLEGRVWITADARLDDRQALVEKLLAKGRTVGIAAPDVELILHAYHVWGEDCVDQLLGDFAFAVWDAPRRRLLCARDHLGIKPFYYFHSGSIVVFSNTLDCIRLHPAVSDRLNDLAIADFLLFDLNQDEESTSFAEIRRIPPAHVASWSASRLHLRRYWTLPIDEPIHLRRSSDYVEWFRELLDAAVRDRMRSDRVGIFMSGGVDSSTLAAAACENADGEVRAFTSVFDRYGNDRRYAQMVADHLGIAIDFYDGDRERIDPEWNNAQIHTSEPVVFPFNVAVQRRYYRGVSSFGRVFFWGEGPDNALGYEWRAYLSYLVNRRRWGQLLADAGRFAVSQRRIPLLSSLPRMLKDRRHLNAWEPSYPAWLDVKLQSRLELRARWEQIRNRAGQGHPVRPTAYWSFASPLWSAMFEGQDPGNTMAPLEVRHPFLDLRLLRYMLAVPVIPWCRAKHLLRHSMRGALPQAVLRRPKTVLSGDPMMDQLRELDPLPSAPARGLRKYVDPGRVPPQKLLGSHANNFWMNLRPISLNYWLKNLSHFPNATADEETANGFVRRATA
jgi:asparagine synthase (glutamine-hydrolysing)